MAYWRRHPRKDLEEVLATFAAAGWRVDDPPKYYRVRCPRACGQHQRWIHLTPSDPNYGSHALHWLYRQPCYDGSES
jgi:hypothetical protein